MKFTTILILFFFGVSLCKFGEKQEFTFTNEPEFVIEDFLLLKNDEILILANDYETNAKLFVIDVSGDNMTTISNNTVICTERPYYFYRFMYINETFFYIECQKIIGGIVYNTVQIANLNSSNQINIVDGEGYLNPGSLFPITIPPNYPTFWSFGDNDFVASIIGLESENDWANTSLIPLDIPKGYGYEAQQAGFISKDGKYLIGSSGENGIGGNAPIWKVSIPDGSLIGNYTVPNNLTYTFTDYSSSQSIILGQGFGYYSGDKLNITFIAFDFDKMTPLADPLVITYPYYSIYSGIPPWQFASFSDGYFYVLITVDPGTFPDKVTKVLHQIQMPSATSSSLVEVDYVKFYYQYSHNLIATSKWIYVDTGATTISRYSIVN